MLVEFGRISGKLAKIQAKQGILAVFLAVALSCTVYDLVGYFGVISTHRDAAPMPF